MKGKTALFLKLFGGPLFFSIVWTYENVALHKIAWQKYPLGDNELSALLAIDGRKANLSHWGGQCVASRYGRTAEWRVDLKGLYSIQHIVILYVQYQPVWDKDDFNTAYLLGFSIYISNTTNKDDGVLCFRDNNYTRATIPNPVNITCPYHGQYVIYYNNRTHPPFPDEYSKDAYNDLCEVEVYGCPSLGFYGENCSIPCPQNCLKGLCHIVQGTCLGCQKGYKGDACYKECPVGLYGETCKELCSPNCKESGVCDISTGHCAGGCQAGWTQPKCDSKCPVGLYGETCKELCSSYCKEPGVCDMSTGHCAGGCQAGWTQPKCDSKCLDGLYGNGCQGNCSTTCVVSGRCDSMTGQCIGGCQIGWKQPKCDAMCNNGTFGQDCTEQCGECLRNEQCHHVNGSCVNGCNPGYHGMKCTEDCNQNYNILKRLIRNTKDISQRTMVHYTLFEKQHRVAPSTSQAASYLPDVIESPVSAILNLTINNTCHLNGS
ncbi:uncharacterized protein LOC144623898 [Crassostrea virginica]